MQILMSLIEEAKRLAGPRRRAFNLGRYEHRILDPRYNVFASMKRRCNNPTDPNYKHYGGRGIYVCDRWLVPSAGFKAFCEDMGPRPDGYTLERIDNDGPYSKDNCKWATNEEQYANRRGNVWLELNGERRTLSQWAKHLGIPYTTLCGRYRKGFPVERILTKESFDNAGKTHCKKGHPLEGDNVYLHRGHRHCKTCRAGTAARLKEGA